MKQKAGEVPLQQNIYFMKKLALLIVLALAGVLTYYLIYSKKNKPVDESPKQQPVAVSKYSPAFVTSVNDALKNYYALSEAFVNWNAAGIDSGAASLQQSLDKISFEELKKDTVIYQTAISYVDGFKADLATITGKSDLSVKRETFNTFSQNFYDLLRTVRFDGSKIFLQECPMAFNDNEPGIWLSDKADIRNPYLGTQHPKYKGGMLECGETKDSLDFSGR